MKRIAIPGMTTLLIVVALIGLNGWNRSGEALQRITLTERELPIAWGGPDDERGMRLRVEHQGRFEPLDARNWLSDERLRELGFVFDIMPGAPEAGETYRRLLPKIAWVAFEYNGAAWREIERQHALYAPMPSPYARHNSPSRLVPVDASPDFNTLVSRYPAGHLVLRASIQIGYLEPSNKGPLVYGYIRRIIPHDVSVPRHLADRVARFRVRDENVAPRYEVDVALGRLGTPYITDIRPLR
jgi:hypothetical protein